MFAGEAIQGAIAVCEQSPNPSIAAYSDHVILLRPDRYVAACVPAGDLEKGAGAIASLIATSFSKLSSPGLSW
jgi:hypothetical protein